MRRQKNGNPTQTQLGLGLADSVFVSQEISSSCPCLLTSTPESDCILLDLIASAG